MNYRKNLVIKKHVALTEWSTKLIINVAYRKAILGMLAVYMLLQLCG